MALSNVCWNRNRCSPNLGRQPESLIRWKQLSYRVRVHDEPHAQLPDVQVSIASYHKKGTGERFRVSLASEPISPIPRTYNPLTPDS